MYKCPGIFWFVQPCGLRVQKRLCTQAEMHGAACMESMQVVSYSKISWSEWINKLCLL